MQRDDVRGHQAQQHQWDGDDVERKEAIQRRVANYVVTANQ